MRNFCTSIVSATFVLMALSCVASGQSSPNTPRNEIELRGSVSVPSGEANFSGTNDAESTLDFNRDFDFQNKLGFQVRYTHRSENGKHKIVASYERTSWNRTTTLTRSFTFRGETYTANATINGDLDLRTFRVMYAYRWGNEKFRFGPMVDMGLIAAGLELTGTTNNGTRTAEGSINKFAATVGYDLDYDPTPKVNLFNNLGVIAFQNDRLFHTEGGVRYYPARQFGVVGGYRYQRYRWVDEQNFLRLAPQGPFFGGVFRF
ncbi:MAG TPA: hypothetical protein VJT71_19375 [Pyrinomonadaceae bacterium]|nr:hypothetical protein [Pyrinomonadaceae bacterium]